MAVSGVPHTLEVRISLLSDRDATVAKAVLADAGSHWNPVFEVTRSSKREPGDPYDEEIGALIAASRVLRAVAARMSKHAEALVKHAEDNKKAAAAQRLRKEAAEAGIHPDDAEAFAQFRSVVTEILAGHGHDQDVVIHMSEGMSADSVPDEIRKMAESLFGPAVQFVADGESALPDEVKAALETFLSDPEADGVRRERPGKKAGRHAKGGGDDALIDPELLDPERVKGKGK